MTGLPGEGVSSFVPVRVACEPDESVGASFTAVTAREAVSVAELNGVAMPLREAST